MHIAILALLVIYDHAIEGQNWIACVFAVPSIAAFAYINGNALIYAVLLLNLMLEQDRMSLRQAKRFHPAFYQQCVLQSYATRSA